MWTCPECDNMNDDEFPECAFCGAEKAPGTDVQEVPSFAMPTSAVEPIETATSAAAASVASAPSALHGERASTALVLVEARTKARVVVDHVPCILGRMGDYCNELFSPQVSRSHLKVDRRDGVWLVAHIGTNPTTVFSRGSRTPLREGIEYPLNGGEMLRMADMTFIVEIESSAKEDSELERSEVETSNEVSSEAEAAASMTEGWFIDCPKGGCGRSFLVPDENSRLSECPTCVDTFDKRRIARVKPVFGKRSNDVVVDLR